MNSVDGGTEHSSPAAPPSPSTRGLRVVLLNLPWASYRRPSIQLGLLAELARKHGHQVEIAHLNVDLAADLGPTIYSAVAEYRSLSLGEWLFAEAAFGDAAPAAEPFLERYADHIAEILSVRKASVSLAELRAFRATGAESYLANQLARAAWHDVDVFGLTSTFQQNCACFAMARLLKRQYPQSCIVAGGANFDAEMGQEWLRCVPALDLVVSGEADQAFPALLDALAQRSDLAGIPNLVYRQADGAGADGTKVVVQNPAAAPLRELDALPTPDYDDFFRRAEDRQLLPAAARRDVDIPIETSRGCWWGQKRHCTFCGLNGQTMTYRSKTAGRVLDELASLSSRYRSYRFTAVDNILDMEFFRTLLPDLAQKGCTFDLFFEVKSGLPPARLRELRAAGVRRIQPGIESLSTHVLQLMNKGVSALANVNLLRFARSLNLDVSWNLIWGFPGEIQQDYERQLAWLRCLSHVQPPVGAGRIWLERFSPLYGQRAAGQPAVQPEASMRYVYPARVDLGKAAYFFEYDFASTIDSSIWEETATWVRDWKASYASAEPPRLEYRYSPGFLQIDERRLGHRPGIFTFNSPYAEIYMAFVTTPQPLEVALKVPAVDRPLVEHAVAEFCAAGLMLREEDQALALALPITAGTDAAS